MVKQWNVNTTHEKINLDKFKDLTKTTKTRI